MRNKHRGRLELEQNMTGSSNKDEPVYLAIGRFGKPHGFEGSIHFYVLTDFPERIKKGKQVFIGEEYLPFQIRSIKEHTRGLIIQLDEIKNFEQAEQLKGEFCFISSDNLPTLPDGEYYHHQLLGLNVFDHNNEPIGVLHEILETGANDVYVVLDETGKEILIPALREVILNINLKTKIMVVKPMEYL
jgi:16S rRNA processing protein RimM